MILRLLFLGLLLPTAALAQTPAIDGSCNDAAYTTLATWSGAPNGFGDANDLFSLRYFTDGTAAYFCLMGELSGTNADGFYLFLDASGYDGVPSGQALPAGPAASGFFANIGGTVLDTGFDADYGFFANAANTPQSLYTNAVRYGVSGGNGIALLGEYLGASDAVGTPTAFIGTLLGGSGAMTQAFQNVPYPGNVPGNGTTGWELALALTALPGIDASQTLRVMAGIATGSGYFSNEMLPNGLLLGNADGNNNLGASPNFGAATWTELFTSPQALPVELVSFTSSANNRSARLSWTTASETNNLGFVVEQQTGDAWNAVSNLIAGHGTTTERNDYA
ncbi:MAG: hypothetical protein LCH53_14410, partial [Bacteroidetes bacterium]|nr:hypothetical protein [Bacteroidota bacterium]